MSAAYDEPGMAIEEDMVGAARTFESDGEKGGLSVTKTSRDWYCGCGCWSCLAENLKSRRRAKRRESRGREFRAVEFGRPGDGSRHDNDDPGES